jgi:D-alanyl-D-alanine carboxypeptidase/D-alanyl-D-alanine-endopeptidase (penicillin-binding protein 4)
VAAAARGAEPPPTPPSRAELSAELPAGLRAALEQAHVADAGSAFLVLPLDGGALQLARHEDMPMNPASTMKLLTTYAALSTLGPGYHWRTTVYASRHPVGARLEGDLIVRGSGDPSLVIERWWLLVQRIRAMGIRDIRGDLVIDRTRYAPDADSAASLDGNELRPYNVAPNALLINFKTLSLDFVPDPAAGVARVVATPQLDGVHIAAQVPLASGGCGDWKAQLRADFSNPHALALRGSYARACGVRTWHVSLLTPDQYVLASFRALWKAAGGTLRGTVREGVAGAGAVPLTALDSPPLAEVIRAINKNSNNVMARQLFLALGAGPGAADDGAAVDGVAPKHESEDATADATEKPSEAQSTARSIRVVRAWLDQQGLRMPELVLQNGSGLSRLERISAASLGQILVHAWNSWQMPNFVASLPEAGVDGTMKNRHGAAQAAFVKTGYLAEVRAIAGYVFAASGHRYVVVSIINDPHADAAQAAHDELLQWVWRAG